MLRYSNPQIVLQEVPDEIALAISISGCNLKCKGCHSSFTWDNNYGEFLTDEILKNLIIKNKHITCVLLYDGLHDERCLYRYFSIIKSYNLKVAFYTGLDDVSDLLKSKIDYLKVGRYIEELGSLSGKNTNQRMYNNGVDITWKFKR